MNTNKGNISEIIESRQELILYRLPRYFKVTFLISCSGFLLTFFVELIRTIFADSRELNFSLSLGGLISLLLTLFANLIVWIFVIWSISSVPYIIFCAYQSSQSVRKSIISQPLKWIRLAASTFLPMTIFALAWTSFSRGTSEAVIQVSSVEFVAVIIGSLLVTILLYGIDYIIPSHKLEIRILLLSSLLYLSLFLTYGLGYSPVSYSMVFGCLIYTSFLGGSESVSDILKGVATYDIDLEHLTRLEDIARRREAMGMVKHTQELEEEEHVIEVYALKQRTEAELKISELQSDKKLNEELLKLRKRKIEANQRINELALKGMEQKINALVQLYDILSSEHESRVNRLTEEKLKQLQADVKDIRPEELDEMIKKLVGEMNILSQGIPEGLESLREEIISTTQIMENETRRLMSRNGDGND